MICFRSKMQERFGITAKQREAETEDALQELGDPDWMQSGILDTIPELLADPPLRLLFDDVRNQVGDIESVYAPAIEDGGHEQHNAVGRVALEVFGDKVRPYLTYRRGSMRTHGREVIPEPGYVAAKMRALACYETQIELENTRPWFMDDALREYMP